MDWNMLEFNSRCKPFEFRTEKNSSFYALGMTTWNDRFKALLDANGWSIPRLAKEMGRDGDQSLIEKLYKYLPGEGAVQNPRGPIVREIANAFTKSEAFLRHGIEAAPEPNATIGDPIPRQSRNKTPIFGHGAGGDDGKFILNGKRVGDIFTPPSLEGVANAYAVYVHGDSVSPRYESGEVVQVNPNRPVRQGDWVVLQIRSDEEGILAGFVKRFVSRSSKELVVEQLNPPKKLRFSAKDVHAVHKIVGSGEG